LLRNRRWTGPEEVSNAGKMWRRHEQFSFKLSWKEPTLETLLLMRG
jgi:hypothetical protein